MKRSVSILVMALLVLVAFAHAEEQGSNTVADDALVAEYESEQASDADALVESLEEISEETDEAIQEDVGMDDTQRAEMDSAKDKRVYVHALQLKTRLRYHIISAEVIIGRVNELGKDVSSLKEILTELTTLAERIEPKDLDKDGYDSAVETAKSLVQKFRDEVHALVTDEELAQVRDSLKDIQAERRAEYKKLKDEELKARLYFNRVQFREQFKEYRADVKELRDDGNKLLDIAARVERLKELRKANLDKSLTAEQRDALTAQVAENRRRFQEEKNDVPVNNERAQLLGQAKELRQAIQALTVDGEDTTDLQAQLDALSTEIGEVRPGKVTLEQAKERKAALEQRLEAMKEKNEQLKRGLSKLQSTKNFQAIITSSGKARDVAQAEKIKEAREREALASQKAEAERLARVKDSPYEPTADSTATGDAS